jgi:PAS domain S-box-containing protein
MLLRFKKKVAKYPVATARMRLLTEPSPDETSDAALSATDRKELMQKLYEQQETIQALERKLRTHDQILDQLPLGVFAKDTDGRHLLINRCLAQRMGREPQDVINRRDEDLSEVELARLYRAEEAQLLAGIKKSLKYEVNQTYSDGSTRVVRSKKWPLCDEYGEIIGVIGISEDITDERHQQDELAIAQGQMALLFENSPLAIVEWNLDGDITNWNPAAERMFGVSRKEALGRPLAELALSAEAYDYAERLQAPFRRDRALVALSGATSTVLRIQQRNKDGEIISRDWTFSILTQTQNVVVGFGAMIADVTAQVRAQQQLEQVVALTATQARMATLKQFVQSISHYFRNHLAHIEVSRHLIQRMLRETGNAQMEERLSSLRDSVRRMAEQLDNLSMISSIAVIEENVVPLNDIAQDAFNSLIRDAEAKSLRYEFTPSTQHLDVRVDAHALRDALRRLLQNAINYTRSGGEVHLTVCREAMTAIVVVRDTGIGMTEAQAERAFDLFYRTDAASPLDIGGLGLGLNIARMTIENHKGTLTLESQPGIGSILTVRLPIVMV